MQEYFKRKEVWLHPDIVANLQKLADKKKWSLKQYMEYTLVIHSNKANNLK
jgi:hypothetical protein